MNDGFGWVSKIHSESVANKTIKIQTGSRVQRKKQVYILPGRKIYTI